MPWAYPIVRQRIPAADVREGDLEALPFADSTFDAVTAVNSLFYAADMDSAMRELVRLLRPGGRVVVTAWGPPERCQFLTAVMPALGPLMPPPPPRASPPHPGALSQKRTLITRSRAVCRQRRKQPSVMSMTAPLMIGGASSASQRIASAASSGRPLRRV